MQRSQLGLSVLAARSTKHSSVSCRNASNLRRSFTSSSTQEGLLQDSLKVTSMLIKHAAAGQYADAKRWKMDYKNKDQRYGSLPRTAAKSQSYLAEKRFSSLDHWKSLETDPKDMATSDYLTPPGTFVEIRRSDQILHGIVLGIVEIAGERKTLSFTTHGQPLLHGEQDIMLSVPSFLDADLASRCGIHISDPSPSELQARVTALKRIRALESAIGKLSPLVSTRGRCLYGSLKSPNPDEWSQVRTSEAAKLIFPSETSVSVPALFAVHKYLMSHFNHYIADTTSYQFTHLFLIRPQSHVDRIQIVNGWMRDKKNKVMPEFLDKGKRVLERSRPLAHETAREVPAVQSTGIEGLTFNEDDKLILQFLYDAFYQSRSIQTSPYLVASTYIITRLGEQPGPGGNLDSLHSVLVDLGIFVPWEDITTIASRVDTVFNKPKEEQPMIPTPREQYPIGPDDLYSSDQLESIRHDFGDLPVFVIDDMVAEELDDGISIEPVASDSRYHWIHIHVADPTRILPPTHHIALKAREVSETMYFNHGSIPMLPPQFHQMSLGKASATSTPEHVMTFSVKVNDTGDIVDYEVRAGIIRNVQILTYEDVDQVINAPVFQESYPFKSDALPPVPAPPNLDQSYIQQLQNLYKVARNIVAGAHRSGTFSYSFPSSDVLFKQKELPSRVNLDRLDKPVLFRGFPEMEYVVNNTDAQHSGARLMVSEFMKAASRAASRFAADRGIPLIRRSSAKAYIPNEKVLEDLLVARNESGKVDPIVVLRSGIVIPRITNTPLPKGHWVLGIPEGEGYVRATSPLRRFADLITHWQIKHTLLNPSSSPLFSLDWMFDFANELTMKERHTRKLSNQHRVYWSSVYVRRWFHGLMDTDLDRGGTFVAHVCGVPAKSFASGMWYTRVLLPELGLWGELVRDGGVQQEIGTQVKARIVEVVKGVRPVIRLSAV